MGEIQKPPSLARKLQGYAFSLRAALLFTVILGVSVPSALSVYQETQQIRLDSAAALKQDIEHIATLLALAMREPLWQLAPEDADSIMEAASVDPRISGIQVNDHAGAIFAQRYRAAPEGEQTTTVTKTVQRGGAVIGTVSIEMATSGYREAVEAVMHRRIRQAVVTILVSILIILVVLRYRLVAPVEKLVEASTRLAKADMESPIPHQRVTELGILAGSLESTRQHLNRLFDALTERNEQLLKTNAELQKQVVLAEEADRAKSDFLATMSHELRTPLNAIIGFAEIMRNEMFGPLGHQKYREYALHIDSSGQLLLSLINDILNLTRIERGHAEFAREAFDVGKVVDASLEQVGHLAARRGVKLISNLAPDLPALCTDFRALHQILLNLLSNAIKYSRLEGRVWLECERADGKRVRFLVVDEGIGIPKDMIEKLGVPFQRVGDPLKTNDGGLGLGLSISKTLVGGLGGELRIRSEWGQGTEVSVTLPIDIGASVLRSTELADALSEP